MLEASFAVLCVLLMADRKPIEPLSAADFTPLGEDGARQSFKVSPVWLGLGLLTLIAAVVLAYLFTARAVIFRLDPAEALVDVGGIYFNIGDNFLLLPGDREISASAEGYLDFSDTLVIGKERTQEIELKLEPLPGNLAINSELDDIEVSIDGEPAGTVPGTIEGLSKGLHIIEFSKFRYFNSQQEVDIEGLGITQSLDVELQPAWGQMTFTSVPAGADLIIDEQVVGQTPMSTEVLETGTQVAIALQGYKTWERQLSVTAGTSEDHPVVTLIVADGTLDISSSPRGANVRVNGEFKGTSPTSVALSPLRDHRIELFLEGYQKATRTVSMEPEGESALAVNLTPIIGRIRLSISPADAEVLVNGAPKGNGSQTLSLNAREHTLTIRKSGYESKTLTITPRPDHDQALDVTLLTVEDAYWAARPPSIVSPVGNRLKLFKPGAAFKMGAARREPGRRANEAERNVKLDRPFYIGTHEVSNEEFRRWKEEHSSSAIQGFTLDMNDQPAAYVSWQDAALFCNWLSRREGLPLFYTESNGVISGFNPESHGYRLPTEAEWAYVARFDNEGNPSMFPWDSELYPPPGLVDNYADKQAASIVNLTLNNYDDGFATAAATGSFKPNARGLFDLSGNVREWMHDFYEIRPIRGEAEVNPMGPTTGGRHTIRGASWAKASRSELRLSARDAGVDGEMDVGFRIARYVDRPGADL